MKTKLKTIFGFALLVAAIMIVLFISKSYYPQLPIEDVPKREVIKLLDHNKPEITKITSYDRYSWYGYKGNQLDGGKALIKTMQDRGLIFVEQMGSGYFFEDSLKSKVIVESQMWTGSYVLYQVPN